MDFSKLTSSERLAAYASAVVLVTGIVAFVMDDWSTTFWLAILGSAAVLAILFVPNINLPWPRGTVLLAIGALAAIGAIIEGLRYAGYIGEYLTEVSTILFLVALVGTFVMAFAGWQAYSGRKAA